MLKEKFRKEINMNCYALSKTLSKYYYRNDDNYRECIEVKYIKLKLYKSILLGYSAQVICLYCHVLFFVGELVEILISQRIN